MSQEHRFCAEVYARLFSLIDRTKRIVVNPDGEAHLPGFPDGIVPPDVCFTFCGTERELRIEAKILKDKRDVKIEESQRRWCCEPEGPTTPHLWMIATRTLEQCWLVDHKHLVERAGANRGGIINLWPNREPPAGCNLDEIAMEIIAWSAKNQRHAEETK